MHPIQPLEPDEAAIAHEARTERARVFNERAISGVKVSPLGFFLLGWALYRISGLQAALLWLTAIVAVEATIYFIARRFFALEATGGNSCSWVRAQVMFQTVAGLAWASAIWFIPHDGPLLGYIATLTILVGVMGYTIVTMCLYKGATWGYFGAMYSVLMLHLLFSDNALKSIIGAGLTVQLVAQVLGSGNLRKMLLKDMDAHVRNKVLVTLMSKARLQLEQVHSDVQTKNTQLNAAIAQLNELVAHDQLTGAYSRRYMMEQMERLASLHQRYGQPVCLIMLDLDHFKNINDRFGHPGGDRALSTVVKTVSAQLREGDMLGRVGGEEFLALMPMTDLLSAEQLAERLRSALAELEFAEGQHSIHLPASFGVAELMEREDVNTWFRRVDEALYQAKLQGRNQVVVARSGASNSTHFDTAQVELAQN